MDEDNFAPLHLKLDYVEKPGYQYDKYDKVSDDPYGSSKWFKDGYATEVSKEYNAVPTEVMKMYFSDDNIKRLQRGIKREVYNRSKGKFILEEDQDVLDLNMAMRAVFELYGKNLPNKIVRQVKRLNEQTIQYIVPDVMENVKQWYGYLQDIRNPIQPMQLPVNVNRAGRNLLPSVTQLWGI